MFWVSTRVKFILHCSTDEKRLIKQPLFTMNLLIIGGTGTLGRQIVKQAIDKGYKVRCITRSFRRANFLKEWGAELVYADLSLPETLPPTLKGINFIIDASTIRSTDNYTLEEVDWKGKIALLQAAKLAGVKKFTCFTLLDASSNRLVPLIDAKLKLEEVLYNMPFPCTIFECSGFFQGLINQYAIPILEQKPIWLVRGANSIAYIDTQEAALQVVDSLLDFENKIKKIPLIGPRFWTSEEVVALCERLSGKSAKILYIPKFLLIILSRFLRLFEFTWNISDRLQFAEFETSDLVKEDIISRGTGLNATMTLESYFQDYFGKILKKLKATNYQSTKMDNADISFL